MNNEKGFTMIELVVILVLIGIIAAVGIPKYLDVTAKGKEKSLKGAISTVRSAVDMFYANSIIDGTPQFPSLNATLFKEGMVPDDVMTQTSSVKYVLNDPIASGDFDDDGGWLYNETTGEVRVDLPGRHGW